MVIAIVAWIIRIEGDSEITWKSNVSEKWCSFNVSMNQD